MCSLGPVGLTVGTLPGNPSATIPTVTDNLFSQGTIPNNEVAISFEPFNQASGTDQTTGELTFGGTDPTKFTGSITFAPISEHSIDFSLVAEVV